MFFNYRYAEFYFFSLLGSSIDYAHSEAGIPISIVMELSGGGWFGFDLPASEIDKNVKESAVGIFAMSETVAKMFNAWIVITTYKCMRINIFSPEKLYL